MKKETKIFILSVCICAGFANDLFACCDTLRTMQYTSRSGEAALIWQNDIRSNLFNLLKLEDLLPTRKNITLNPKEVLSEDKGSYLVKEVEINATTGRRIRVIVTLPNLSGGPWPAVVCIHGHGGKIRSVYEENSIYKGFASELASSGYVTIACLVSQHTVYEEGRMLMGERLWDLIRCVDYLESLNEVDKSRIGCAGLSLGGEMAMWLGGMDTRIKATVSAGFLTKMDQMEQNHCMCWKFPGLRRLVDFADIYSLVAPRSLSCQNGVQEPPDQFYVPVAREAFTEIETIYRDLNKAENLLLDVHQGAHEIYLPGLLNFMEVHLNNK